MLGTDGGRVDDCEGGGLNVESEGGKDCGKLRGCVDVIEGGGGMDVDGVPICREVAGCDEGEDCLGGVVNEG